MNKVKGLLFDFNGTLFFDSKMHISIFQDYFAERGKEPPTAEFVVANIFGRSNPNIYATYFAKDENDTDWESFADDKENRYRQFCLEHPELMRYTAGVEEMLDYLKANGIPYALATGAGPDNIEFYMKHMGLGRWFDESNMVYTDGSFRSKPEPDIYILAAKKLGLDASECAVFEDGRSGVIAAQRAEAGAIVCVYEEDLPSPLPEGDSCEGEYNDFTEWKDMLRKLGVLR